MIKRLLGYFTVFTTLFFIVCLSQKYILNQADLNLKYNYWNTNLFFYLVSFIICVHFLFLSEIKSIQTQLGYIYLPTLFIKGGLFYIIFKPSISQLEFFSTSERLNLLIPFLLFLSIEVFFIAKILNKKSS
jgi:hypothetical protein